MPDRFKVARISGAHGIRGEVKLDCFLENPDDITSYNPLSSVKNSSITIKITGHAKGQLIVAIEGVQDRNAAELLRGVELFATRTALPEKTADEYYYEELIGLQAVDATGKEIGTVKAMHNFGAGDILEIQAAEEILLPFKAPFVQVVHLQEKQIVVQLPEYLGDDSREA